MASNHVTTKIDQDLCVGCGLCVTVCPSETLTLEGGKARVTGAESLNCGHCAAVCAEGAVTVSSLDEETLRLSTLSPPEEWVKHGKADADALVALMRSRRSCRNFRERPVDLAILQDLVKIGISAPSGTNCQLWTFTLLPTREAVMVVGDRTLRFFKKLNKLARNAWLRGALKLVGKPALAAYHDEYCEKVTERIMEYERTGRERLFHGATAAILVGARKGATTPAEDALLSTQNILLAAHAMGLGTCLVGFVVEAARKDASIKTCVGIPADEVLYAVIALGYPGETYRRQVSRMKPLVRVFDRGC